MSGRAPRRPEAESMPGSGIPQESLRRIGELGKADIVVGIPSYNNARTIGHVVRAAQAGDGSWAAAAAVERDFTVAKATLTVTAASPSSGPPV